MIILGYDFYTDENGIEKPNGLIGQKITEKNKGTSNIFSIIFTTLFNRDV